MPRADRRASTSGSRAAADAVEPDADRREIALGERQRVDVARGLLHPLVLEQAPHELGARVFDFDARRRRRPGQQQPRLDLDQHRGHQQVFRGELELRAAHHLDVAEILARELGHRDVEHVDVLRAGSGTAGGRAVPRTSRGKPPSASGGM